VDGVAGWGEQIRRHGASYSTWCHQLLELVQVRGGDASTSSSAYRLPDAGGVAGELPRSPASRQWSRRRAISSVTALPGTGAMRPLGPQASGRVLPRVLQPSPSSSKI
jgi:hypothetical protein